MFRKRIFNPARGQAEDRPAASSRVGPWRFLSRRARSSCRWLAWRAPAARGGSQRKGGASNHTRKVFGEATDIVNLYPLPPPMYPSIWDTSVYQLTSTCTTVTLFLLRKIKIIWSAGHPFFCKFPFFIFQTLQNVPFFARTCTFL